MLTVHNTLTRRKEAFHPIEPGRVRMYVCGVTVYDYMHVGHARMFIVFDTLARYLRYSGYQLVLVRNITDIDDKIIRRAAENGESVEALTDRFTEAFHEDCERLAILPADHEPRATAYVDSMIRMIETLEARGFAYRADNGDVYYRVREFPDYGRLSGKRREDLRAGARVEVQEAKEDPLDFVLWKSAKPDEPSWDSPWGPGRPGWHIECSAMSTELLGETFDIHGGGMDLQFPHHENEIAQSCGAHGGEFVRYWMHNGFVQVDDEKMSKSLGNFFTVREVLKHFRGEELRYFVLSSHYRSPVNYAQDELQGARTALNRLYTALRGLRPEPPDEGEEAEHRARFSEAMDDDLNTPQALAVLFDLAHEINRTRDSEPALAARHAGLLRDLGAVLGLLQADPEAWLKGAAGEGGLADEAVERLVAEREAARERRDFDRADAIRDELAEAGVVLEDGPGGTSWRRG